MITAATVLRIAGDLLGTPLTPEGYGPCPGQHLHTTPSGATHWRLFVDPASPDTPHDHCFHASCAAARDDFMRALYSRIRRLKSPRGETTAPASYTPSAPPVKPVPAIKPAFDPSTAERLAALCPGFTLERLTRISPVPIPPDPAVWPTLLLDTLYQPTDRILLFTNMRSQGQYLYQPGTGLYRLAATPGTRATRCPALPLTSSPDGMWYLAAPVTGQWLPKPNPKNPGELGRRHAACCTSFPYAVIESDSLPPEVWLPCLAQLQDPIVAVYTSGGKSIHALVRVNAPTPAEFNTARAELIRRLLPIGADPAALTPVRLTRLPGATRGGNLQRLLYLNPRPLPHTPLSRLSLRR